MLVTAVPYLAGYASQGEEWRFTGFLIGVEDGNSYIAKMLTGAEGAWLFRSPFSAEPQRGVIAFLPYLVLGKLSGGSAQHEQLVAIFHTYRFLAGILAALALNDFLVLFIKESKRRLWALIVILIGGGMGWVVALLGMKHYLGSIPLDFLSPESFGLLGLFGLPHLALARALLFWGAACYLKDDNGIRAGVFWSLMGFWQPLYGVIIWVVIGLHGSAELARKHFYQVPGKQRWRFRESYLKKALVAGLISSPLVIYTAVSFMLDPYLAAWNAQNNLVSPHIAHYLIGYGLVLPLAIGGVFRLFRESPDRGSFLASWMIALPVLVNIPISTQRRLAEGIWVVLITGFFAYFKNKKILPFYGKIVIGFLFPTTIFLFWGAFSRARLPSPPLFLPTEKVAAYQALKDLVADQDVVLTAYNTGNSLPAWVPATVVLGHGPETVHLNDWQNRVDAYMEENRGQAACGDFFMETGIDYLFWGPTEKERWAWDPAIKKCLKQVYNAEGYMIYQVKE